MDTRLAVPAFSLACALACGKADAPAAEPVQPEATLAAPAKLAEPELIHGIAWFEDAPDAARARALREHKPVLVDLWAPWCHTCLSMKNFVLTREHLGELADQYVFLSVNTER